jgi:hypothetical protein
VGLLLAKQLEPARGRGIADESVGSAVPISALNDLEDARKHQVRSIYLKTVRFGYLSSTSVYNNISSRLTI